MCQYSHAVPFAESKPSGVSAVPRGVVSGGDDPCVNSTCARAFCVVFFVGGSTTPPGDRTGALKEGGVLRPTVLGGVNEHPGWSYHTHCLVGA